MIIEGCAAAIIAVTAHNPFGEPERATGRWLPFLRLGTALALCGAAIGLLALAAAAAYHPQTGVYLATGVLGIAENVMGFAGIGLITSLVTGGLAGVDRAARLHGHLPVRTDRQLLRATDLGGPPGHRPGRLDHCHWSSSRSAWPRLPSGARASARRASDWLESSRPWARASNSLMWAWRGTRRSFGLAWYT